MKSNKQRRQEIKAQRLRRSERQIQIRRVNARPVNRPVGTEPVTPALLRHNNSYGIPDFVQRGYYQDRPLRCKDCGIEEVWTAVQQRWWYEVAQGDVWTVAFALPPLSPARTRAKSRSPTHSCGGVGGEINGP